MSWQAGMTDANACRPKFLLSQPCSPHMQAPRQAHLRGKAVDPDGIQVTGPGNQTYICMTSPCGPTP